MRLITNVALPEVPVNILPMISDSDFKTRVTSLVYNSAGMDLVWNFVDAQGNYSQTAVTPTTGGVYDWVHQGDAMYSIEVPKSGGASINNNAVGIGWFSGIATGVVAWRGPEIEFVLGGEITSGTPTTTGFICADLPATVDDAYKDSYVHVLSGNAAGCTKKITAFTASSKTLAFNAMHTAMAVGDRFMILSGA